MAVDPKTLSATPAASAGSLAPATGLRRYAVWAEIAIEFAFLEFALWAPTRQIRNRWAAVAALTIVAVILADLLIDRQSLKRLGLGLPGIFGACVVLVTGVAASAFLITLVS